MQAWIAETGGRARFFPPFLSLSLKAVHLSITVRQRRATQSFDVRPCEPVVKYDSE